MKTPKSPEQIAEETLSEFMRFERRHGVEWLHKEDVISAFIKAIQAERDSAKGLLEALNWIKESTRFDEAEGPELRSQVSSAHRYARQALAQYNTEEGT